MLNQTLALAEIPKRTLTRVRGAMESLLDFVQTPHIQYLSGAELTQTSWWPGQIVAATEREEHLPEKTFTQLKRIAEQGLVIVATDSTRNHLVVGSVALWPLGKDEEGHEWYEMGTLWVHKEYRHSGKKNTRIAHALFRRCLMTHADKNILANTTNNTAIHFGIRHDMVNISFYILPKAIHRTTCVCPVSKTATTDNMSCPIKDGMCRLFVTHETWQRIGTPDPLRRFTR